MNRTPSVYRTWISRLLLPIAAVITVAAALIGLGTLGAQEGQMSVDCGGTSGQVIATCQYGERDEFTVAIHAVDAPAAGYAAFQAKLRWDPAVIDYRPSDLPVDEAVWPDCGISARNDIRPEDFSVLWGCATFPVVVSHYTGVLVQFDFACIAEGTSQMTLVAQADDDQGGSHFIVLGPDDEQIDFAPLLLGATVTCGGDGVVGDVDCSGAVSAIDAALVLQFVAALIDTLPCQDNADVNGNGSVDAIDATLILQFVAGLLPSLG